MAVYNLKTGAVMREFHEPELAGEGTVLCVSSGGSLAAYARGHDILAVDLSSGNVKSLATVADLPQPGYLGACAFGERTNR